MTTRGPGKSVTESFSRPDNASVKSGRNRTESGRKSVSNTDGRTPRKEQLMPKQLPLPDNRCGNCL